MEKKKKLQNKQQNAEAVKKIKEYHALSKQQSEINKRLKTLTVDIKNFMFINGVTKVKFDTKDLNEGASDIPITLICKQITPKSVKFDPVKTEEKLSKVIPKKRIKDFISCEVSIDNWDEFSKYMKKLGADPKVIKKMITVRKEVLTKELDNASKLGLIEKEDLNGSYTVINKTSYIRVDEVVKTDEEEG